MAGFVYVDNSSVFMDGQRVAAVENGFALNIHDAISCQIFDHDYRLDFGKLYKFVANNGCKVKRPMLFGPRPPQNDSLWAAAESEGFEVVVDNRSAANPEKKIDTGIVAAMCEDAFTQADKANDTFILVAGDGDYAPAVARLVEKGFTVNVVFWEHASQELQDACSNFIPMNPHFASLSRESVQVG